MTYTVKQLAQIMNIGVTSAYNLVNTKNFPKLVVGNKILVPKKSLEKWIDENVVS
jgi:excisionase family DNA binding protein